MTNKLLTFSAFILTITSTTLATFAADDDAMRYRHSSLAIRIITESVGFGDEIEVAVDYKLDARDVAVAADASSALSID